jgi:hypothetical protein
MTELTSWENPMMQYCVKWLRIVPGFNDLPEIAAADKMGGKPGYANRVAEILFSGTKIPYPSGDYSTETVNAAIEYINKLGKDERIEFVAYMRMYANAGMAHDAQKWQELKEREAQRKRYGRAKDPNYARGKK